MRDDVGNIIDRVGTGLVYCCTDCDVPEIILLAINALYASPVRCVRFSQICLDARDTPGPALR